MPHSMHKNNLLKISLVDIHQPLPKTCVIETFYKDATRLQVKEH